ncbi:MAG: hypothetical protein LBG58_12095 [Planctomycetaceae bacterium]|jgi:hypothetical protein|nr:hypothetical protein [Planctomycetaceae bacterium]
MIKFRNIINQIHGEKFSAGVQAAFLSLPATYTRKDGTEKNVFVTPEPVNSETQYATLSTGKENFTAGMQIFTMVLKSQDFNVVTDPPSEGDMIDVEIGGVPTRRFVTKNSSGRCWNYLDGKQKIWIMTTTKKM